MSWKIWNRGIYDPNVVVDSSKPEKCQAHKQVKANSFILAFDDLNDKIHSALKYGLNGLEGKNDKNQLIIN